MCCTASTGGMGISSLYVSTCAAKPFMITFPPGREVGCAQMGRFRLPVGGHHFTPLSGWQARNRPLA